MLDSLELAPDDRVLLISAPPVETVRLLSARLPRGLLVGLAGGEELTPARRACADLDNVMFVPAGLEEIPWQNGFFSKALSLEQGWRGSPRAFLELARVVARGGRVYIPRDEALAAGFAAAGFTLLPGEGTSLVLLRP